MNFKSRYVQYLSRNRGRECTLAQKMILLFLLFALTCVAHVQPKNETETAVQTFDFGEGRYQNGTSPSVNASASVFENYSNTNASASIVRALDFYNTEVLRNHWKNIHTNLTSACQNDMEQYIQGLNSAKTWALKSLYSF